MRHRGGLGCGGAVGLGAAVALIIAVIAIGHALFRQLTGAVSLVITFAEVAVCVILGAVVITVLGGLVYGGQLGRLKLAERRIGLELLARGQQVVQAEVLNGDGGTSLPGAERPAIGGERAGIYSANVTRLPVGDRGDS